MLNAVFVRHFPGTGANGAARAVGYAKATQRECRYYGLPKFIVLSGVRASRCCVCTKLCGGGTSECLADVYAEAYINENGNLVVNLTKSSPLLQAELLRAAATGTVLYNVVRYDLKTLNEIYTQLTMCLYEAPYFSVVLSETNNTVNVYTDQAVEACEAYVSSITDVFAVTIIEEENVFSDCAYVRAGDR